MERADWLCQSSSGAVQGVSQGPSPHEVLVTVQQEGVICYDTVSKVNAIIIRMQCYCLEQPQNVFRQGSHSQPVLPCDTQRLCRAILWFWMLIAFHLACPVAALYSILPQSWWG